MRKYKYKWNSTDGQGADEGVIEEISSSLGVTAVTAKLLMGRGCGDTESAASFLAKTGEGVLLHDPFMMAGMDEAVRRILDAVEKGEKIMIYGDYDVDGVTSVCAILTYLRSLSADVDFYIPNRAGEGYGMSVDAVRTFANAGIGLIITVDTGITAVEEAKACREYGVSLVVTDHHECHSTLPEADAIVNPRQPHCPYPFKELAGVGVVFKVLCATEKMRSGDDLYTASRRVSDMCIDLIAIGTVADVMPLKDENRLIVAEGLRRIETTERPGLVALMNAVSAESKKTTSPKKITSGYISYSIAPRVNATGRISSASIAVDLFMAKDEIAAESLARKLCDINRERQRVENEIAASAREKIDMDESLRESPVIVLDDETWHHGIIGIVSSRLTERYGKPSVLVSFEGSTAGEESPEDVGKGSGRSVRGMNLVNALHECGDILEKYGGHELAAGLSVKRGNLPELRRRLAKCAERALGTDDIVPGFDYDTELRVSDITMRQATELYLLEPYGVSNPQPMFVIRGLTVDDCCTVGAGKHTKFTVKCGDKIISVMCFRHIPEDYDLYSGDRVDILFSLDINEFQGQKSLQFIAKDIRLTESQYNREMGERERYASLLADLTSDLPETKVLPDSIIPSRKDFAFVYNLIKSEYRLEHRIFSARAFLHLIRLTGGDIGYIKLRFILRILSELSLVEITETDTDLEVFDFRYIQVSERTSLDTSPLYRRLQACRAE